MDPKVNSAAKPNLMIIDNTIPSQVQYLTLTMLLYGNRNYKEFKPC